MHDLISITLTVLCIVIVAKFIIKKINPVFVFFASGIFILLIASILTKSSILGKATTGNMFIDVFAFITQSFTTNIAGIGTIIMAVTGYAVYMSHIKAANKLAIIATKPLMKMHKPYLVLSGVFLVGMALKLVITSQAGLALLMLSTTFPILIELGINKTTAASVLCLICLDWGPNDGSTIFAAKVANMPVVNLFLNHQLKVGLAIIIVTAIVIPIYYSYVDRKDTAKNGDTITQKKELKDPDCPAYYAILPVIPLLIVLIFGFIKSVKMDVVTANIIGFTITFIIEFIRRKDRKEIPNDMKVILQAMGNIFVNVVAIIIAASVFAEGINRLGGISIIANLFVSIKGASIITIILMTLITFGAAVLMGSGAASWFAFGPLVPNIALKLGIPSVSMIVPMELGASLGRSMSPVAGAIIAIAGFAEVDTIKMVKRTAIPLIIALVVNIIASYVFGLLL